MIKIVFIQILFTLLSSCGTIIRFKHEHNGVGKDFKRYVKEYNDIVGEKYNSKINNLSIGFKKLDDGVVGKCYWLIRGGAEIDIDPIFWEYSTYTDKKFVVYHELEHCIRKRMHSDKQEITNVASFFEWLGQTIFFRNKIKYVYFEDGCPRSLMNSYTLSKDCQTNHYLEYIEEMKDYSSL